MRPSWSQSMGTWATASGTSTRRRRATLSCLPMTTIGISGSHPCFLLHSSPLERSLAHPSSSLRSLTDSESVRAERHAAQLVTASRGLPIVCHALSQSNHHHMPASMHALQRIYHCFRPSKAVAVALEMRYSPRDTFTNAALSAGSCCEP